MDIYIVNKDGHLCYNTDFFQSCMRKTLNDSSLKVLSADYQTIVGETATTKMKYKEGDEKKILGLDKYRIQYQSQGKQTAIEVLVKSKTVYKELIDRLAQVMIAGGVKMEQQELDDYLAKTALYDTQVKEILVYQKAISNPNFGAFFPPVYGTYADDKSQVYVVIEGFLENEYLIKDYTDISYWDAKNIHDAVTDLAKYHSVYYDCYDDLIKGGVFGEVMTSKRMLSLMPMYQALYDMIKNFVGTIYSEEDYQFHNQLLATMGQWWGVLDSMKKTLIFNDIQIRNFAMRENASPRLCMFDWECATIHIPQRDLVELLSYILSPNISDQDINTYLKLYFDTFNQCVPNAFNWNDFLVGCLYALYDYQVDRVSMQLALDRIIFRPDIERVFKTSRKLLRFLQSKA